MPAYSRLMTQLRQGRVREWALQRLTTHGEACRAMIRENLRATPAWVIEQVTEKDRPFDHVIAQLGLSRLCKTPAVSFAKDSPAFPACFVFLFLIS